MDINKAYELIRDKLYYWLKNLITMLPNLALAALVVVLGILLSRLVRRFSYRIANKISHIATISNLFSSFIYLVCLGITFFIALNVLHLDQAVTSVLAGAGIVGLALAFAFQDIAANFMSGIFLSFRRPLRVGDIVRLKDYMGKVEVINLRDTVLRTFQGQMVIIPNKEVFQNPIENFSLLGKRRMDLNVGISYGDDLEKVKQVTLNALENLKGMATSDEVTFFYQSFGDSSINFMVRIWVATPEQADFLQVQSEAIIRIKKAFDENNITIPFPIRTLDFGIKGGQLLSEVPVHVVNKHPA